MVEIEAEISVEIEQCDKKSASVRQADGATNFTRQKIGLYAAARLGNRDETRVQINSWKH